jgi:hypothetical protein
VLKPPDCILLVHSKHLVIAFISQSL